MATGMGMETAMRAANPERNKMKALSFLHRARIRGVTLADLLVGTAVSGVIAAGMLTTISAIQRSSSASNHHTQSQIQQARLVDYIARDLRRALSVTVDQYAGAERLKLKVPDYYDASDPSNLVPREPVIDQGGVRYGAEGSGVEITYFKNATTVYRSVNGRSTPLATDLDKFQIDFTDDGKQAVTVAISFVPRFQFNDEGETGRQNTTAYATTLLRNKRQ